jgi:hypothetical protein
MKIERLEISGVDEIFEEDYGIEKVKDPYMIKLLRFANEAGLKGRRIKEIVRIDQLSTRSRFYDFICEDAAGKDGV